MNCELSIVLKIKKCVALRREAIMFLFLLYEVIEIFFHECLGVTGLYAAFHLSFYTIYSLAIFIVDCR